MSLIPLQVDASHGGTGINALTGPPAADKVPTTQGDGTYALETQSGGGSGDFGGAMTLEFVFSDDITAGDPGTSKLALNAAAPNQHTATVLVVDDQDANATVISQTLAIWDDSTSTVKGFLRIVAKGDASKWIVFSFTSLTQPSGYTSFALTYVNASYTSFANGDAVLLCFDRTGDAGAPGADGVSGVSGVYTPTLTNGSNVSASTAYQLQYFQVGDCVTVSGAVDIQPTVTLTQTRVQMTLPVTSNHSTDDLGGVAAANNFAGESVAIVGDPSTSPSGALLIWKCISTSNMHLQFTLTYRVVP